MTPTGHIKVNPDLRVSGHNNIFAIGDITDIPEVKLAHFTSNQASVIANNIKVLRRGDS